MEAIVSSATSIQIEYEQHDNLVFEVVQFGTQKTVLSLQLPREEKSFDLNQRVRAKRGHGPEVGQAGRVIHIRLDSGRREPIILVQWESGETSSHEPKEIY